MMSRKVILIVLDSAGVGQLPDAAAYGDAGADTLGHIMENCAPQIPNLMEMGLGHIDDIHFGSTAKDVTGSYGKMREVSAGKDTTTGHWEIAGVQLTRPFPTFPDGFPKDFLDRFEQAVGRGTIGNKPASGTAILDELGEEHMRTGKLIVYTSADSVFQIAAHEEIVPLAELYHICEIAREMLVGELEVGRVIARPFIGERAGAFKRTGGRRDYSAVPPTTMLDLLCGAGKTVYAVGKIEDIFCLRGITKSNHAAGNPACMEAMYAAMQEDFDGLLFVNLVDFDMVYGHRRDVKGYAAALEAFDREIPRIKDMMGEDDLLIITADHGCDPCHTGTDHTREHVPLLIWGRNVKGGVNLGVRDTYADIAATVLDFFGVKSTVKGTSVLPEIV